MQDQNDTQVPENQDVPQEATQEQPVVEEQAPSQETAPTQEAETPQEQPVAPQEEPEVPDASDYNSADYLNNQPQAVQPDEDGYIDPNAFRQSVIQEVEQKLQFEKAEAKAWGAIETKYPEIANDPELKELVNAQRIADVAQGGAGNLGKIADKVVGKLKAYQQQGKAQAQVSETVQKSAGLQTASANKVETNKDSDLIERMSRGDETAQEQLISDWLAQGKI